MRDQMEGLTPNTDIQKMMESLGCTGDSVKPKDIVERIECIEFETVTIAGNKFMYCGIRMLGGFVVVGKPATCIDPSNWRDEIGRKVSFDNSFDEIYKLEAYRKMSQGAEVVSAPKSIERSEHVHFPEVVNKHFKVFTGKPTERLAYQLTEQDIQHLSMNQSTKKANLVIDKCFTLSFAFHCPFDEIKAGDYVVFLNSEDTYHCSEEVFNERNIT